MTRQPFALPRWARGAAQAVLKIAYPLVLLGAWHFGAPRYVGIALLTLLWAQRWVGAGSVSELLRQLTPLDWLVAGALTCTSAAVAITNSELLLRLYPALVNAGLLLSFAATLRSGPSMIEKFARMRLPDLQPRAVRYTRRVTQVWCGFFALNGMTAVGAVQRRNRLRAGRCADCGRSGVPALGRPPARTANGGDGMSSKQGPRAVGMRTTANAAGHRFHHQGQMIDIGRKVAA